MDGGKRGACHCDYLSRFPGAGRLEREPPSRKGRSVSLILYRLDGTDGLRLAYLKGRVTDRLWKDGPRYWVVNMERAMADWTKNPHGAD